MTISTELEAQIKRYYHAEKWRVGTIAHQLHVHHSVVQRVLAQEGIPQAIVLRSSSMVTPYLPFILETLKKYPTLSAARLYEMVQQRGYQGASRHFRHVIALHRPRPVTEAYLRLRTLPGEQAQVDWGHFGHMTIGKARRALMAFVMVLSFSRQIFLRFYLNAQMANFLRGHNAAFEEWKGVPRVILSDNLKSAVLERQGEAIRFNPEYLAFAGHYRFEARPVAVARGNEKGRVERAIRYVRENFFAARNYKDLDDLNDQAYQWCQTQAANRPCPEDKTILVREAFLQEQPKLLILPTDTYPLDERVSVKVGKTPYVRFDLNDYSVPHPFVRRALTVSAHPSSLKILDEQGKSIAEHPRSYDKGKQIEDETHIEALIAVKGHAAVHRGQNRLTHAIPISQTLLVKAADRGYAIGSMTVQLLRLLDQYGTQELTLAIEEALRRDVPHTNAVRLALQKHREEQQIAPLIELHLSSDPRVREITVQPHALHTYDALQTSTTTKEEKEEK